MENYIIIKFDKNTGKSELEIFGASDFEALGLLRFWEKQKYIEMNGYFKKQENPEPIKSKKNETHLNWWDALTEHYKKHYLTECFNNENYKPDNTDIEIMFRLRDR